MADGAAREMVVGGVPFVELIPPAIVEPRKDAMAADIAKQYEGKGDLLILAVAMGGGYLAVDLARRLADISPDLPVTHDEIRVRTEGAGPDSSGGIVRPIAYPLPLAPRQHVLVVDALVNRALALRFTTAWLTNRTGDGIHPPESLAFAALVDKPGARRTPLPRPINFIGFSVMGAPNLMGEGMDGPRGTGRGTAGVWYRKAGHALAAGYAMPDFISPDFSIAR